MAKAESCHNCVYSHWDRNLAMWTMSVGVPSRPTCGNQPDFPGRMRECPLGRVCRNFRPRPPTPTGETVKTIPLGKGFYAYVDAADYEWLSRWKWYFHGGYAIRCEDKKVIYMHRQIMEPPEGMVVDHRNHNKLDNTRDNLRVCTPRENRQNTGKRQGTSSRFIGVGYRKKEDRWCAWLIWRGKQLSLGYFIEEIEAARARDHKAVELLGELAWLNLPEEWPPERRAEVYARFQARLKREGKKGAKDAKGERARRKERRTGGRPRPRVTGDKPRATSAKSRTTLKKGKKARVKNKEPDAKRTTPDARRSGAKRQTQKRGQPRRTRTMRKRLFHHGGHREHTEKKARRPNSDLTLQT